MEPIELTQSGTPTLSNEKALRRRLKQEEGLRLDPYLDSKGNKYIGYGHKLKEEPLQFISKSQACEYLKRDIEKATKLTISVCAFHGIEYANLQNGLKNALIDLCYQIGSEALSGFEGMLRKVRARDFAGAGLELMNSRHATVFTCRCLANYWMMLNPDTVISEAGYRLDKSFRKEIMLELLKQVIKEGILPTPTKGHAQPDPNPKEETKDKTSNGKKLLAERLTGEVENPHDQGYVWQAIARNCYKHYEPIGGQNIEVEELDIDLGDTGKKVLKEITKETKGLQQADKENVKVGCFGPKLGLNGQLKGVHEAPPLVPHRARSTFGEGSDVDTLSEFEIKKVSSDDYLARRVPLVEETKSEFGGEYSTNVQAKLSLPGKIGSSKEVDPGEYNPIDVRKPFGRRVVAGFLVALSGEVNKMRTVPIKPPPGPVRKPVVSTGSYRAGSMVGGAVGGVLSHADEMEPFDMAKEVAKSLAVDATITGLAPTVAFTASKLAAAAGTGAAQGLAAGIGKAAVKVAPMVGNIVTGALLATNIAEIARSDSLHSGEKWLRTGKSVLDVMVGMGAGMGGAMVGAKLGASVGSAGGPIGFAIGLGGGIVGGLTGGLVSRLWHKPMCLSTDAIKDGKFKRECCNFDADFTFEWDRTPGNAKSFIILMAESDGSLRWQIININPLKRSINVQNVAEGKVILPYLGVAARDSEVTFQLWALDAMISEDADPLDFAQKHVITVAELKAKPE